MPENRIEVCAGVTSNREKLKPVRITEGSNVKDFAEKLKVPILDMVSLLMKRGVFATLNQSVSRDVAVDVGKLLGYEVIFVPFEQAAVEEPEN